MILAPLIKYFFEGLAVAIAAFFIPRREINVKEIILIALTSAAIFSILDATSPTVGLSVRQGAGFGIGLTQVGWGDVKTDATIKIKTDSNDVATVVYVPPSNNSNVNRKTCVTTDGKTCVTTNEKTGVTTNEKGEADATISNQPATLVYVPPSNKASVA